MFVARNLSVRARLAILLVFMNGLLIAGAGYSWYAITRLSGQLQGAIDMQNQVEAATNVARQAQLDFKKQVQEWKDTLLRASDAELLQKHQRGFEERSTAVKKSLVALKPMVTDIGLPASLAESALEEHAILEAKYAEGRKLLDPAKPMSAFDVDKTVRGIDRAATDHIDDIVKKVQERGDAVQLEAGTTCRARAQVPRSPRSPSSRSSPWP